MAIRFQVIGVTQPGFNGISIGDTYDVAVPICVEPILSPRNNRLTLRHALVARHDRSLENPDDHCAG